MLGWRVVVRIEQKMGQQMVSSRKEAVVCRKPWPEEELPLLLTNQVSYLGCSNSKKSACNVGDLGSIPRSGRSLGEGKGYPLQYFCLENSMNCIVHGVAKSQTWLSKFHFHFLKNFNTLEMPLPFSTDLHILQWKVYCHSYLCFSKYMVSVFSVSLRCSFYCGCYIHCVCVGAL